MSDRVVTVLRMRLVAWNIQGGGGKRIAAIAAELVDRDADAVVISEIYAPLHKDPLERLPEAGDLDQVTDVGRGRGTWCYT